MSANRSKKWASRILILLALSLLIPIYNAPTWWVSLEAPNYPEEAFPDGVRILFHVNGVFNGCEKVEKEEILEDEALDCVHEMDTINHYVGMYPIASGGPVELFFSIFLLSILGVMLLGYISPGRLRPLVMGFGFLLIAVWMGLAWFSTDGLKYHNTNYLKARVTVLGEDTEAFEEPLSPAEALIARLKEAVGETQEENVVAEEDEKSRSIAALRSSFDAWQRRHSGEPEVWKGSGAQVLGWHYGKSLGRYFNDPEILNPMIRKMVRAVHAVFWAVIAIMVLLPIFSRKDGGLFHWLLLLIPATLPLLFVLEYAVWLGWYGHNMNDMGAFTLKPFMPTVFGQGKVAQFTTNSYPEFGFFLMLLFSGLLVIAAILKLQQGREGSEI